MRDEVAIESVRGRAELDSLRASLPVLVEVRFVRSGTSSDWYVCSTDEELDEVIGRVAPGHELIAVGVNHLDQRGWVRLRT